MGRFLFGIALAVLSVAPAARASITITSSSLEARVFDGSGAQSQGLTGIALPTSATLSATKPGNSSDNSIEWSVAGGVTTLSFDMEHVRAGSNNYAETDAQPIRFTANASEPYALSGYYNVTDVGSDQSNLVVSSVDLRDVTAGSDLFANSQVSESTHNEQFVIGETGGDANNNLVGSPTGNLIVGHSYAFSFDAFIYSYYHADSGASAVGNLTLTIGAADVPSGVVPEPMSLLAWGGLAACSAVIYRRKELNRVKRSEK